MATYWLFLLLTAVTIVSPGPGVMLTLSNAMRHGYRGAIGGILGIAAGSFVVAGVSAAGLGALLAYSPRMFAAVKIAGAAYLIFLGVKLWLSQSAAARQGGEERRPPGRQFLEAVGLQLTNPQALVYFVSVFPQFIDAGRAYWLQFIVLIVTFALLIVIIHSVYAALAGSIRLWMQSSQKARVLNRLAAVAFVAYGATVLAGLR